MAEYLITCPDCKEKFRGTLTEIQKSYYAHMYAAHPAKLKRLQDQAVSSYISSLLTIE